MTPIFQQKKRENLKAKYKVVNSHYTHTHTHTHTKDVVFLLYSWSYLQFLHSTTALLLKVNHGHTLNTVINVTGLISQMFGLNQSVFLFLLRN